MSERRKYKQWLINSNEPIPKRTRTRYNNYSKAAQLKTYNQNVMPMIIEASILTESSISTESAILNETSLINATEDSADELLENIDEEFNANELNNILHDEEITREELSAAYLAAFYNCGSTQRTLTNFLQLHNISSSIKLPTYFSGLINIIDENFTDLNYVKSWYCGTCMKKFNQLKGRFQRECEICDTTKYVLFLNI